MEEEEKLQQKSSESVFEDKISSRVHEVSQLSATGGWKHEPNKCLKKKPKYLYRYEESLELLMTNH